MSYRRGLAHILQPKPTDIVIASALRTPITRAFKGPLAPLLPEDLLLSILKATVSRLPQTTGARDSLVGTCLQPLAGQKCSAAAVKAAGLTTSTVATLSRQCSSSAQAISFLAAQMREHVAWNGDTVSEGELVLAAGVESMSNDYLPHKGIPERMSERVLDRGNDSEAAREARDVIMSMGTTSENVAREWDIGRERQDAFAVESHRRAAAARSSGHFAKEIAPVEVPAGEGREAVTVEHDDGIREGVSMEKMAKLSPVFDKENGRSTAGNSSQVSDGASAVVLMTRRKADELGIKPIGKFVASVVRSVPSRIMGIAPAVAVPALLELTGVDTNEVDIWELNEAFASQSLYCIDALGLDAEKVNPYGGAIALGHPLGATGGRMVATLLNGLNARHGKVGVVTMCASTGQGWAGMFVKE